MAYKRNLNPAEFEEALRVLHMLVLENKLKYATTIGYIDYYADAQGNIYSISPNMYQCKKIKLVPDRWGYLGFTAYGNKGVNSPYPVRYLAHKLVAMAFHGTPNDPKMEIDHINGNKSDNRPENLEWVTHSENCLRAVNKRKEKS